MTTISMSVQNPSDFDNMTTSELRTYLKARGLKQMAKDKAELVQRAKDSLLTHATAGTSTAQAPTNAPTQTGTATPPTQQITTVPTFPSASMVDVKGQKYIDIGSEIVSVGAPASGWQAKYPVVSNGASRFAHLGGTNFVELASVQPQSAIQIPAPAAKASNEPRQIYITPESEAFVFAKSNPESKPTYARVQRTTNFGTSISMFYKADNGEMRPASSHLVRFPSSTAPETIANFQSWMNQQFALAANSK